MEFSGTSIALRPHHYCFGNTCVSGRSPTDLPDVGDPEEVVVGFPRPGWSFTAIFRPADEECGRMQEVALAALDDGKAALRPAGYADRYHVTLFGRGNGSLTTSFTWTTPADGPLPQPD